MKKIIAFLLLGALLLGLCGCNTFEDTPETDAAFAAYEAAISQTIAHKKGAMTVVTENKDTVENTESVGVIEYHYTTDEENKVTFEREDYTNGEPVASYYGDGKAAYQMDQSTGEWVDVTEESEGMLNHDENYMNTLSLFRIDNNFRYSKHFYESVTMEEAGGEKVITFTLKDSAVTKMFSYSDEREIRRTMAGQYRSYYINEAGDVYKIVIDTTQEVVYKGTEGTLSNVITVQLNYD
ncbi:MAG: hypothetical protein IJ043_02670 [Clostridia bacterium]|nr:hypothetical protein [Clostridia bacterium]